MFDNLENAEAKSPIADDAFSVNATRIAISGCLKDKARDGSFQFTAKTTSSVPLVNDTQKVIIPSLGYSVAGIKDTNGTSDDPNKPFAPLSITITNYQPAPENFKIAVSNQRNCAKLQVNGAAPPFVVNVANGGTSNPIPISGVKVDGKTSGRFRIVITSAPLPPCDHSVLVE